MYDTRVFAIESLIYHQEAGSEVLKQMGSESNEMDRIFPMPHFKIEIAKVLNLPRGLSENDVQIILSHLGRDKSAIVYDNQVSHKIC